MMTAKISIAKKCGKIKKYQSVRQKI